MKKLIIPILSLAMLASCSKSETGDMSEGLLDNAIRLSAGVGASVSADTKAVIKTGSTFTPGVAGWESAATVDYSQTAAWETTTSEITSSTTPQAVTLDDKQVYNANNAVKTYMKAWYPQGTLMNGTLTFTSASDGTTDVLMAPEVVGSKSDRNGKILAFVHMTTQLKFVVKEGAGLAADTKLVSIKVKDAELPTGIDLTNDQLTCAPAADLTVPGINGDLIIGTTADGDLVGNPVMIKPITGNKVHLDITTSKANFPDVEATIDTDTDFAAGKAYIITLTFSQSEIELGASLAAWTEGSGSGTVE